MRTRGPGPIPIRRSAFAGFCFPPDVIVLAIRWYLRFGLSYRAVEELLAERGVEVDHVTVYRWVGGSRRYWQTPPGPAGTRLVIAGRSTRPTPRSLANGATCTGAIDQAGQVIDVFVAQRRHATAAHRFFERTVGATTRTPIEVVTDKAPTYPAVLEALLPGAWHRTDRYAHNHIEADHGRLTSRLTAMRGCKQDPSARIVIAGHAFVQNVRRGHYELAVEEPVTPAGGGRIRRAGPLHLTPDAGPMAASPCRGSTRCNTAASTTTPAWSGATSAGSPRPCWTPSPRPCSWTRPSAGTCSTWPGRPTPRRGAHIAAGPTAGPAGLPAHPGRHGCPGRCAQWPPGHPGRQPARLRPLLRDLCRSGPAGQHRPVRVPQPPGP
jgi:transposase-like protein